MAHRHEHDHAVVRAGQRSALLVSLVINTAFLVVEVVGGPADVEGGGVLIVAAVGIVINVGSALVLLRNRGGSLNMRGALVHVVTDAIGLAGTFVAALAVLIWDATWADPAASLAIALLVVYSGFRLLADTVHVLLEGTPSGMDRTEVETTLLGEAGVDAVHHLHLWSLATPVRTKPTDEVANNAGRETSPRHS